MNQKLLRVGVQLRMDANIAKEVAYEVLLRMNPHQSMLTAKRLEDADVTLDNMVKYYLELGKAVAEFWNSCWDMQYQTVLKPHEMRNLYLPLMYAVIFSSVGNLQVGNYQYVIKAKADEKPDRKFLVEFSATLESMRDIIKGDTGQIGNRGAQPQTQVMMCLIGEVSEDNRSAEMLIRDGQKVDTALAGLSTLVGLSLVEEAYRILYTGVEEVNFRQLYTSIVEKQSVGQVATVDS